MSSRSSPFRLLPACFGDDLFEIVGTASSLADGACVASRAPGARVRLRGRGGRRAAPGAASAGLRSVRLRGCPARRLRSSDPAPARPRNLGADRGEPLLKLRPASVRLVDRLRERLAYEHLIAVDRGELVEDCLFEFSRAGAVRRRRLWGRTSGGRCRRSSRSSTGTVTSSANPTPPARPAAGPPSAELPCKATGPPPRNAARQAARVQHFERRLSEAPRRTSLARIRARRPRQHPPAETADHHARTARHRSASPAAAPWTPASAPCRSPGSPGRRDLRRVVHRPSPRCPDHQARKARTGAPGNRATCSQTHRPVSAGMRIPVRDGRGPTAGG